MQDGRSARAQRPRWLMTVHLTRQIARDTGMDSPEHDGAQFDIDTLAKLLPKLSGTGTMRFLYHMSDQVLDTLNTVEVVLRRTIQQTVTAIKMCTDDANWDRSDSIKCQTWTDVAQWTHVEITGTNDAGCMSILDIVV